jgi:asparagine synthase (glutamine-hydrolysing)
MSAIVAAYGPFDPAEGARMLDRLTHRGPDGEGHQRLRDAWLGHRRLAIVDLEGGEQPLHDTERGLWLVGDGEVYNHVRLRTELEERGHTFRTRSDHETILHLLTADGPAALTRLWGMYAVIAAGEDGSFVAARDRIGIAPLYWARDGDTVVFASELKAFDPARRNDVEPFPPGHTWSPQAGLEQFHALPATRSPAVRELVGAAEGVEPPDAVLAAIRGTLVTAVERCMVADVPIGTLLSGGLDSSIVTAIAARITQRQGYRLPTFSTGLADSEDLAAARQLASELGTEHYERIYTEDELIDWVPEVIGVLESFDPQLVHSSVPNLLVSKLASRHVKVVLIGEGADELFAGYAHYGEIENDDELHIALIETIEGLHAGGLQRVDRVAGVNGLEPRLPFLDVDLVELGLGLPARWKLAHEDRAEKWLLRKAFEGWLPDELLWRRKAQFGEGTGARDVLREHYGALVGEEEFARERRRVDPPLRTPEEVAYFRLFQRYLTGMDPEGVVSRFAEP